MLKRMLIGLSKPSLLETHLVIQEIKTFRKKPKRKIRKNRNQQKRSNQQKRKKKRKCKVKELTITNLKSYEEF